MADDFRQGKALRDAISGVAKRCRVRDVSNLASSLGGFFVFHTNIVVVSLAVTVAITSPTVLANEKAEIFGAMPAIRDISLSPDGNRIAFISPGQAQCRISTLSILPEAMNQHG